jgi:hypothetical protein
LEAQPFTSLFDEFGDYRKRIIVQDVEITALDDPILPFFDAVDTLDAWTTLSIVPVVLTSLFIMVP